MQKLIIPEEDIVLAICMYIAEEQNINADDIQVELFYDDYTGFSAEIITPSGKKEWITKQIITALREWIRENLHADPYAGLKLNLDRRNGIYARLRCDS